ncbi:hypothetical protein [Fodinibius sp.]|uniref:hypothetical protein n=1 Tax=Fodinibius sp. TaxID=1872440 RepID=UPI002ACD94F4|nr:hypothetical protein [Fodinibius sp.]MDZ7659694.1 hypothetical protein [Fodinibius sp.]
MPVIRINSLPRALFLAGFVVLMMLTISEVKAQSFDHEPYPKLDFNFVDLELNLGVQPQNLRIDGEAKYQVEANISGADTLTLYASHMDISNVLVDGNAADFSLQNDSLFILVDDSAEAGSQFEVNIRYSGRPQFGVLQNRNETIWSSQLPRAQRHWVPIVDHPQVTLKTTFNISVPSGVQVWATGTKAEEEVLSVDAMRYQFVSQKEVPASSLAFAIGSFENESTRYGEKKINLAVEKSLGSQIDPQALLQNTQDYLASVEEKLQRQYPYEQLQVVVLEDHNGETKSWGASTIFLYKNRGDLDTQLMRGIIGQWFGVKQRERQWSQADAITLSQTLLLQELTSESSTLSSKDQPQGFAHSLYSQFGPERWNSWQKGIGSWQNESVKAFMRDSLPEMLDLGGVISWEEYANFWYDHLGQPLFNRPQFSVDAKESSSPKDSVAYEVYYEFNEAEGTLKLRFKATHGYFGELTTIEAYAMYPGKVDTSKVTFTGKEDSIVLQVQPTINTLRLSAEDHPTLTLDEFKPASFLISELRNGETVEERAKAARKLGYHSDNPDLQLAIQDFMKQDLEPKVEAGLLLSMADITDGASGTEQVFLDALKSDHQVIREAGLMALQNYPQNSTVVNTVQAVAQRADELSMFKKATQVLTSVMAEESFSGFVESVVQSDSVGMRSIFAVQELANMGQIEDAVEQANLFTDQEYAYPIRSRAYQLLIQHDRAAANWLGRAEELTQIADPRIRFLVLRGMEQNINDEIRAFLKDYRQDEYDARVYRKIEELL